MNSDEHVDVEDLLRLVDRPGPLPGELEEDLRAELLASLAHGPLIVTPDAEVTGEADIIDLALPAERPGRKRPNHLAWLVAVAAVSLLVLAVALGPVRQRSSTTAATPTPVPVLVDIEAACARFVDTTPARAALEELVDLGGTEPADELRRMVAAIDVLLIDAEAAEVAQPDLDALELTRSRFNQTLLFVESGSGDAANSLDGANTELGGLADERFVTCRTY